MTNAPTIGEMVTLLVAFPTVLGYTLAHLDADAVPFKNAKVNLALQTMDAADDLSYVVFGATSFWALMDTIAASMVANGEDPPAFITWIDIAAPALISALTVPAHDGGLPFTSAIKLDDPGDVYDAVSWGVGALSAVFTGVSYYVGEKYSQADADVANQGMLFLTSLSGFTGAGFGVIAAVTSNSNLADAPLPAVLAVLRNTASMLAYGLEKEVVAGSEGISAVLAGVIGGVCTFTASVIYAFGY